MLGKTHKYVGACCGVITTQQLISNDITPENMLLTGMMVSSAIIAALALDVDHKNSTYGKKFPVAANIINTLFGHRGITHAPLILILIISLLLYLSTFMSSTIQLFVLFIYGGYTIYKLSYFILKKFTKKSISIILGILSSIGLMYYLYNLDLIYLTLSINYILIGFLVGGLSHIFLDYFNPKGVPLFYPFTKKKFRLFGISEKYGCVFSFIFTILTIISTYFWYGGLL